LIDCWEEKKQKRRKKRYRIDLIPIYSYKTGTLSYAIALCNEYKRKKVRNLDKERLKTSLFSSF
jgi:hypothetical protein